MSMVETITAAINFAALVFLGAQVMFARRALKETSKAQQQEWERQCKKASIEVSMSTARYREELKSGLPWNDRDPEEVAAFLKAANNDHVKLAPVRQYLNHMEDIAVGVTQGVFDLKTIAMLQGSRTVDTVANYMPYIKSIRQELNRPGIYSYLEMLAQLLTVDDLGSITPSQEDVQHFQLTKHRPRQPTRSRIFSKRRAHVRALTENRAAFADPPDDSSGKSAMLPQHAKP